jgi:hypothetical protein
MRSSRFKAASLTTALPMKPPLLTCQAFKMYQRSARCPFYSYPFIRAVNPTDRGKKLAKILSEPTKGERKGERQQPEHQLTQRTFPTTQPSSAPPSPKKRHKSNRKKETPAWTKSPRLSPPLRRLDSFQLLRLHEPNLNTD